MGKMYAILFGIIIGVAIVLYEPVSAQLTPEEEAAEPGGWASSLWDSDETADYRPSMSVPEAFRAGGLRGAITQIFAGKADCNDYGGRPPRRCVDQRVDEYFERLAQ